LPLPQLVFTAHYQTIIVYPTRSDVFNTKKNNPSGQKMWWQWFWLQCIFWIVLLPVVLQYNIWQNLAFSIRQIMIFFLPLTSYWVIMVHM